MMVESYIHYVLFIELVDGLFCVTGVSLEDVHHQHVPIDHHLVREWDQQVEQGEGEWYLQVVSLWSNYI